MILIPLSKEKKCVFASFATFKSPWINRDANVARANLKDLYNLYRQCKIQEHRDIYKAYKKQYNVILKTAKANYVQNIITSSKITQKYNRNL
jgi:hypothetical protein